MEISITQAKGKVPVSIIKIKGDLDASSYLDLVGAAQKLYESGSKDLLLDLTDLTFISSAGLASLHIVTKMFRGGKVLFNGNSFHIQCGAGIVRRFHQ